MTNDDDELTSEGQVEEQLDKLKRVAKTFNRAAMMIYVKQDLKAVPKLLEQLRKSTASRVPPLLRARPWDITEYLIDTLLCVCAIMISDGGNLESDMEKKYDRLCQKWKKLLSSAPSGAVKATLSIFKARLCRQLGGKEEKTLGYCLEATRLDPGCYLWYHWAYRSKRRIRRGERDLKAPSKEEEALAMKAYQLRCTDSDLIITTDYALVLKDTLWTKDRRLWTTEECTIVLELFRDALRFAKKSGNKHWEVTLTVYIAEILAFGKKDAVNEQEGRRLLEELAKKYPPNTMVLHKLGKVYIKGVGGEISKTRAAECFHKAIELCPTNFGCIMDYLKLLEAKCNFMEMMEVCDKALEHCKSDGDKEKLTAMRAAARERACLYQL